jgi:drug/metabolite transporter (DMT)-like permease
MPFVAPQGRLRDNLRMGRVDPEHESAPPAQRDGATASAYRWGIVALFAAGVFWSLSGALIKLINEKGTGPHGVTIAFYRSLFAGLCILPLARGKFHTLRRTRDHTASRGRSRRLWLRPEAIICMVFFTLMTASFVVANTMTQAANVIILQYTSTFWIFALSPWVLREKPKAGDLWILALAMIGIAIIFGGNASASLFGLVIALGSGLFFGILTLMIRRLRDCDSAAVTVFNNLGSAILLLPAAWLIGELGLSARGWLLVIALGVVQFGLPYYLYTVALTRVPAYQAALITMVEPVLVPVWAYLAVSEKVPLTTAVGGGVILVALAVFILRARKGEATANGES